MAARGSQHEQDEITWNTAGIRLGLRGLDLRQPSDPDALTKLLNARFLDDRLIRQRDGHSAELIQDSSSFAPLGPNYSVSDEWALGHGRRVSSTNAAGWENAHHPIPGRGEHTFHYDGTDVVWTGDRLLVAKEGSPSLGGSSFWGRSTSDTELPRGIPAYLPLQTDSTPTASVTGDYIETCLTESYRVYLYAEPSSFLTADIVDRGTGAVVSTQMVSPSDHQVVEPKVVNAGGVVVALWRDSASDTLYISHYTGAEWTTASNVDTDVKSFDVVAVSGGFYVLWRTAAPSADKLFVGKYATGALSGSPTAIATQDSPFAFATEVPLDAVVPDGPVALAISPSDQVGIACGADGALKMRVFSSAMEALSGISWTTVDANASWVGGVAICSRGLKESDGQYQWVVHASRGTDNGAVIAQATLTLGTGITLTNVTRHNSILASKSWRVGDEVFCWLRSGLAGTHYLVGGTVPSPQVCGYADREEAIERVEADSNYAIPHVAADPLDEDGYTFTWIRPYNTGQTYRHGGNARVGDMDFLPEVTSVKFGRSQYISGCAVRNWDGIELGDAGFQDWPTVKEATKSDSSGELTATGVYYLRIYAVRYNKRGERFTSPAVSHGPVELTGTEDTIVASIRSLPSTNHDDVEFECYRTEAGGTTFYLEGTVANDLTTATVSFTFGMSDADLIDEPADSHAAGVGALSELEEIGPLGCSMLAVSGDRLWGAGGQVTPGTVQFSKLKEEGEGAGFDDLAGFQIVDTEGRTITSVHTLNDITVVHEKDQLYIISGTGPDNYGRGAFTIPQIVLSDGAVNNYGALTQVGRVYWGKDGPRLLTTSFAVVNISLPVLTLSKTLTPSGCRSDLPRKEVIFYTREGKGLLWNYLGEQPRWAEWSGLKIASCSQEALLTTDGYLLFEDEGADGDGGQSMKFVWRSGNLRPEQILQGHALVRAMGLVGQFLRAHTLRFKIYYNGSPLHSELWEWDATEDTWLTSGETWEDLTPAEVDALLPVDRSGSYVTHKRTARQSCHFFQVELSTESTKPVYVPYELSLEVGARGGLGRVPVNTFSTTVAR